MEFGVGFASLVKNGVFFSVEPSIDDVFLTYYETAAIACGIVVFE
jgi:hypothetical protein